MSVFDWEGIKRFWSSKAVKKSLIILAGVVALMGVIVLVSVLAGCSASNHYTKVKEPALVLTGKGRMGNFRTAYFVVANPTSERQHFVVKCCMPLDPDNCTSQRVVVAPRSDKKLSFSVATTVSCGLEKDPLPGSA